MMPVRRNDNWLPSIFSDLFDNDWTMRSATASSPAINVVDKDDAYQVEVATPGLTKEDFTISIDKDRNIVIAMEKKEENKTEEKGKYIHREFSYAKFKQTLVLPDNVNVDNISAKVENGVLEVNVPKLSEDEVKDTEKLIEIH